MFEISFWSIFWIITFALFLANIIEIIKNKKIVLSYEIKFLMFYVALAVIIRIVYFPMHHVNGHIDTLKFDSSRIIPFWLNLIPVVHLFDIYDGWQINIIGNIAVFIPLGIIWPFCFGKLNSVKKTAFAGFCFSLFIEISQLFFYDRCSDVDDLILNTAGVAIGAFIWFRSKKNK